jgi:hypothetical protein
MPPEVFRYDTVGLPVPSIEIKVRLRFFPPPLLLRLFLPVSSNLLLLPLVFPSFTHLVVL